MFSLGKIWKTLTKNPSPPGTSAPASAGPASLGAAVNAHVEEAHAQRTLVEGIIRNVMRLHHTDDCGDEGCRCAALATGRFVTAKDIKQIRAEVLGYTVKDGQGHGSPPPAP